jgi:hypothetical protein
MKSIYTFLLLLNISILSAQTAEEKQVQSTVINLFEEVFSNLNDAKILDYTTPDLIIFETGEIYNLDSITTYVRNRKELFNSEENKNHLFKRLNKFEFLTTKVSNETAYVTYKNNAVFTMNGNEIAKVNWLESAHLIRTKNGWRIVFLHSTEIKEN